MLVLECIHFESDLLWNLLGFETKHLKQSRTCEILFSAGSCCMLDFWTRNITRLKGKVLESDVSHRIHLPQWFYALCNLLMHYWNHMVIDFSNHVDWQLLKLTPQDTKFIPNWQVPNWQGWKFNAVFFPEGFFCILISPISGHDGGISIVYWRVELLGHQRGILNSTDQTVCLLNSTYEQFCLRNEHVFLQQLSGRVVYIYLRTFMPCWDVKSCLHLLTFGSPETWHNNWWVWHGSCVRSCDLVV